MPNKRKSFRELDIWTVASFVVLAAFLLFVIYPMATLFIEAFQDSVTGEFSLSNFKQFFSDPYYYNSFFNSMKVTLVSTVITMVLGTTMAYILTMFNIKGRKFIELIMIITMLSPPFIGAYSWIMLFGNQGLVTGFLQNTLGINAKINIYGYKGIIIVFSVKLFPYVYMLVRGALKKTDATLLEASESLGYHGMRKMMTAVYPLILPTVLAAALISFSNAFADYGTPALIGQNYQVLATLVYNQYVNEVMTNSNLSSAMGVLMIFFTLMLFALQRWMVAKRSYTSGSVAKPLVPQKAETAWGTFVTHGFVYLVSLVAMLPQITVIYISFLKSNGLRFVGGYTLGNYAKAWDKAKDAIINSYKLSIISILVIVVIGMIIGYVSVRRKGVLSNILDTMSMVPFIIPGAILGIMLTKTFNSGWLVISGTSMIMVVAYVMRRMMYTIRSSSAILHQLNPALEEASISLGYTPFKTFVNVTGRLMLTGVMSGAIISWIACINELSSSLMLYSAKTKTMSVYIYLEASRGYMADAAGMAAIMTFSLIIAVLIMNKVTGSKDIVV